MKKLFIFISMCLAVNSFVRAEVPAVEVPVNDVEVPVIYDEEEEIYRVVEKKAQFPGGNSALVKFLSENVKYPEEAIDFDISGNVIVQFVVKSNGSVGDVRVVRSVHPLLDEEAVRVVKSMPNWTPAEQRGKPVNSWFTLPIKFALPK
ncbi:MAG: energy transducer TonB [Paludibacteraceae bacterium]|nr:energy transducer TonB [Paludibacteraceae bacterium]